MGSSSININSISIDLADAAKEIDMVKCDHFSIRGFVAETRERNHRKSCPFSEESVGLVGQQSYSLPSLYVPKFRWWRCMSCIRDIDGTKDCGHSKSRTITETKLDGNSLVTPVKTKLNSISGNAVDQENADIICERSQKNDQITATVFDMKVHPRSMDSCTVRRKSRKFASRDEVSNKRPKEKVNKSSGAVTTFRSSEIAGVIEDQKDRRVLMECDNMSSESINLAMKGLKRRKTRKIRLLSELLNTKTSSDNIRKEESACKKELVKGRKRKLLPENSYVCRKLSTIQTTFENVSKSCDSDLGDNESSDSLFDKDPIKGKQKNRRFQVVDEFVQSIPSETSQESYEADPGKVALSNPVHSAQRTEKKLNLAKKSNLTSFSSGIDEGSQAKPQTGPPVNAISQSNTDLLNENRVVKDKPVSSLHLQDNDHVRSRDAEVSCLRDFGSSSKSNTSGWLRTGVDVFDFSSNNNKGNCSAFANFNLRQTSSSTEFADLSCVLQKDGSGSDRKGKTVMVQEHHVKENTPEEQNDDIPMEIVELMAKNQYERCLPDKEEYNSNKQTAQETTHKSKNALLIDLNETYDNGISLEDNNITRQPNPCDSNVRKEEQQKSIDFFPISQPYVPSPFSIFPPTHENRASSIRFSDHNCQWLGNKPTMANQNPSPYQYREASHPIWTSSMILPQGHHHKPVSFNMAQTTKPGPVSQPSTWNLNFVGANEKQKCGSSSEFSYGCQPAAGGYNESSIPALHLLSLMDPRLRSDTPTDHHGNTKFTKRHFPPVNQTGDSSKTAFPTKQLPFDYYNNRFTPETSHKSFPIIPPLGTSSFSFQNPKSSWSHHQTKRKDTFAPVNKSHEKLVFTNNNDQGRFQLLGVSNSMMIPLKQKRKPNFNNSSVWNGSGPIVCSVNRNPADFTIPEPGNAYMLTGENLKVRKRTTFKKKPSLCKQDALKQTEKPACPHTENT